LPLISALELKLKCKAVPSNFAFYFNLCRYMKDNLHLPVTCIDDSERTLAKLNGVTDPEKKRKAGWCN